LNKCRIRVKGINVSRVLAHAPIIMKFEAKKIYKKPKNKGNQISTETKINL